MYGKILITKQKKTTMKNQQIKKTNKTDRNQTHQTKPNDSCGHMMSIINSNCDTRVLFFTKIHFYFAIDKIYWKQNKIQKKIQERRKGRKITNYIFHNGKQLDDKK